MFSSFIKIPFFVTLYQLRINPIYRVHLSVNNRSYYIFCSASSLLQLNSTFQKITDDHGKSSVTGKQYISLMILINEIKWTRLDCYLKEMLKLHYIFVLSVAFFLLYTITIFFNSSVIDIPILIHSYLTNIYCIVYLNRAKTLHIISDNH